MPKFMAVHTMPMTKEQALQMTNQMEGKLPQGLIWKQTYCDFPGNKFFCDWEAPNKEALEQYFKAVKMPFDAVYPVELFNVASKSFVT
jgi:Protein of unknown function (DUF4242)